VDGRAAYAYRRLFTHPQVPRRISLTRCHPAFCGVILTAYLPARTLHGTVTDATRTRTAFGCYRHCCAGMEIDYIYPCNRTTAAAVALHLEQFAAPQVNVPAQHCPSCNALPSPFVAVTLRETPWISAVEPACGTLPILLPADGLRCSNAIRFALIPLLEFVRGFAVCRLDQHHALYTNAVLPLCLSRQVNAGRIIPLPASPCCPCAIRVHTAYADRHGLPVSNSKQTCNTGVPFAYFPLLPDCALLCRATVIPAAPATHAAIRFISDFTWLAIF